MSNYIEKLINGYIEGAATVAQIEYIYGLKYIFTGTHKTQLNNIISVLKDRKATSNMIEKYDRKLRKIEYGFKNGSFSYEKPDVKEKYYDMIVRMYVRLYNKYKGQKKAKPMKFWKNQLRNFRLLNQMELKEVQ